MISKKNFSKIKSVTSSPTPGGLRSHLSLFLNYLENECGMAENTLKAYRTDLKLFLEWQDAHGPSRFHDLNLQHFSEYLAFLHAKKFASSTIARRLVSLKVFFRYLVLEGVILESQAEPLSSPKLWQRLPKVLSPDKVDELLSAPMPEDRFPLRDRALLAMLYATGCRASELTNIRLRDLSLEEAFCRCTGKGNKERMVSLNPLALSRLDDYLENERPLLTQLRENGWLFVTKSGNPLSRIMVWNLVKKYAARIGCNKNVSPHTLRHSFATHLLAGGAEIRALQEMLGHANVTTTQLYTQVEHSRLKAVHQKCHPRG